MLRPTHRRAVVVAGAFALVAAAAPPASAERLAVRGGDTTLRLDRTAAKALKGLGVSVTTTERARSVASGLRFPVTRGTLDVESGAATIRHTGGLRLRAGARRVTLSDYNVVLGTRSSMSARVNGGKRLGALVPDASKARVTRDGLRVTVANVAIRLSPRGARALNATFRTKAFRSGLRLGTATVRTTLDQISLTGGATALTLAPAAASALGSLGITPGLIAPATAGPGGALQFPITGGKVNARSLAGQIRHSGGITLSRGSTVVPLTDFTIDTRKGVLTATLGGGPRAAILSLSLDDVDVTLQDGEVRVSGVTARLTGAAAGALNAAFATTAFTEGLLLGTATVAGEIK